MSEDTRSAPPTPSDLLEVWRRTAADLEQRWNDFLNQAMGTDVFAQTMARSMDGYLAMQETFAKGMEQYLRSLNIPTRSDFVQIADRIGRLEQRIADLTVAVSSHAPETGAAGDLAETEGDQEGGGGRRQLPSVGKAARAERQSAARSRLTGNAGARTGGGRDG